MKGQEYFKDLVQKLDPGKKKTPEKRKPRKKENHENQKTVKFLKKSKVRTFTLTDVSWSQIQGKSLYINKAQKFVMLLGEVLAVCCSSN